MQPSDFIASLQRHEAAQAAQPDQEQEFTKAQFQSLVAAMAQAHEEMVSFLKEYQPKTTVENFPDSIKTPDAQDVVKAVNKLEKALKPVTQDNSDVVRALIDLNKAVKGIDVTPTYKPEITVTPAKVDVKAPIVNVDAPKIDLKPLEKAIKANKPEELDLKPVLKALKDVSEQIIKKPTPVANTPTDPLIYYLPADIDDAGTVQYFGYTDNKGAWYIRRFDTGASPKTLRFAFGQSNYATNFVNRAALTYVGWGF